jgi:phosphoesterase RecJ-like protein
MMTRAECARFFAQRDNFVILTHSAPDGDTLGSAGGLCLGLRAAGKTAAVLENPETPEHLAYLVQGLMVSQIPENAVLVSVDVPAPGMLPEAHQALIPRIALRIDHHGRSTSFTELELVDPGTAACAEIVYDILVEMGVALTAQMAIPIYTGTATDTGCFSFANTTAHTFTVAAACAATGANLQPINQALFDTVSLQKLRVQAWVTGHTKFFCGGKAAVCAMPVTLAQELDVAEEDVGGMSGFVRSIEGVCMAATLRESDEGKTFISMRAVPGYDCAAVCEKFGGGGHKGAAGGGSVLPLAELEQAVMEAMKEQFGE